MIEEIDLKKVYYIVEYGPSTGVFTEKLIKRRNLKTIILLVENNKGFYFLLKAKFKEEGNLLIVYGSAVNIEQYIKETISLISIMLFLVFRLQVYNKEKIEMSHLLMSLVVQYEKKCGGIIWSQTFLLLMMIKRLEILSLFIWKMKV
ncbi:hypothetical protein ACWFRC_21480 [Bacillus cereus]